MKLWIIIALIIGVVFMFFLDEIKLQISIDKCLDSGGNWDYENKKCNKRKAEGVSP